MSKAAAALALLDPDARHARALLRGLREEGLRAAWFTDIDGWLLSRHPYGFECFVLDASVDPDGRITRLLRKRTAALVLAFARPVLADSFRRAMAAGADLLLPEPLDPRDVAVAMQALRRRTVPGGPARAWELVDGSGRLKSPAGRVTELQPADRALLACFGEARGSVVTPQTLTRALGRPAAGAADNLLHAAIYRLRRRVERDTGERLPLRGIAGTGYRFEGTLTLR